MFEFKLLQGPKGDVLTDPESRTSDGYFFDLPPSYEVCERETFERLSSPGFVTSAVAVPRTA
jgi:hypothetical protein